MIMKFDGSHSFLSNFHPWPVRYKGFIYPTSEHAFQASKAVNIEDVLWIASASTPGIAKSRGRRVRMRDDWDSIKLSCMLSITRAKFELPERRELLLNTSDVPLIEGNYWHDQFWGNCMCSKCPDPGKNYLGKILMHVRKELRQS